jgi:hypothetical protein
MAISGTYINEIDEEIAVFTETATMWLNGDEFVFSDAQKTSPEVYYAAI